MHLALRTHLYIPDATIIIYTTFQSYCRKRGIWRSERWQRSRCWSSSGFVLTSPRLGRWSRRTTETMQLLLLGKWGGEKKHPQSRQENRDCVWWPEPSSSPRRLVKRCGWSRFFKNHSLNVSISHNFKQLIFFFILQQCHKFSAMASKSKKVLNMCCVFCIVSMQFVFPFLVFFVLLFARTFNTEPLLVLGRGCEDPNTCPEDKKKKYRSGEWMPSFVS